MTAIDVDVKNNTGRILAVEWEWEGLDDIVVMGGFGGDELAPRLIISITDMTPAEVVR